jgi:hypothetical protein
MRELMLFAAASGAAVRLSVLCDVAQRLAKIPILYGGIREMGEARREPADAYEVDPARVGGN